MSNSDICDMPTTLLKRAMAKLDSPKPDDPGEWASFRAMQKRDKNGIVRADFDSDGKTDLLWVNSANTTQYWMYLMNGVAVTGSGGSTVAPGDVRCCGGIFDRWAEMSDLRITTNRQMEKQKAPMIRALPAFLTGVT